MAVKIRLRQQGRNNRQTYRLVVTDVRCPRDGKYLEMLGWYNPIQAEGNVSINAERLQYWLSQGAECSPRAEVLMGKCAPEVMKAYREKRRLRTVKETKQRRGA